MHGHKRLDALGLKRESTHYEATFTLNIFYRHCYPKIRGHFDLQSEGNQLKDRNPALVSDRVQDLEADLLVTYLNGTLPHG